MTRLNREDLCVLRIGYKVQKAYISAAGGTSSDVSRL